jgi:hypothetical protein
MEIYSLHQTIVAHEDAFIDLAFELGPVEGLTAASVKHYIRYIADRRLTQLGLDALFHVDRNPLPWRDEMLNAVEHTKFFETAPPNTAAHLQPEVGKTRLRISSRRSYACPEKYSAVSQRLFRSVTGLLGFMTVLWRCSFARYLA